MEISGQKLWCGSLAVIEYLLDNPEFVTGNVVLELGAGTGVLGMLCERLGARHVILTDHDRRSIEHMKQDIVVNNIVHTAVEELNWFNSSQTDMVVTGLRETFPSTKICIVAGDVLYKRAILLPFFQTVARILGPGDEMLLCHVPRAGIDHDEIVSLGSSFQIEFTEISPALWRKGACEMYSTPDDYLYGKLYTLSKPKT